MRKIKINKPHFKFFGVSGTPAIGIGQRRGDILYLNRFDSGRLVEKSYAIGSCAYALTGHFSGVRRGDDARVSAMQGAWAFVFGVDSEAPVYCEKV